MPASPRGEALFRCVQETRVATREESGVICFPSSLWVIPVHQPQASCILHQTWTGDLFLTRYYTCFNATFLDVPLNRTFLCTQSSLLGAIRLHAHGFPSLSVQSLCTRGAGNSRSLPGLSLPIPGHSKLVGVSPGGLESCAWLGSTPHSC